jgi:RNA polymerase sigma factor (sigma-70 family)
MSMLQVKFEQDVRAQNVQVVAEVLNTRLEQVKQIVLWADRAVHLDLEPGEYLVRAQLPSGEVLRKTVKVGAKSPAKVTLSGTRPPHEVLGLQHFLGHLATIAAPMSPENVEGTWLRLWSCVEGQWKSEPWAGAVPAGDEWGLIARISLTIDRVWLLQIGGDRVPHRFIAVPPSGQLEILLRGTTRNTVWNGGITIRLATLDAELEALMQYQASGAAESANAVGEEVAKRAEDYASDKLRNPNGAALGFYYLLSRQDLKRVHEWPHNFANWTPWLPDAAILYAMQLLMSREPDSRSIARDMLIRAAGSAVPVYTKGLRYVWDQLCTYKQDPNTPQNEGIDRGLERIEAYAAAADWNEPRTTFFGARPDAPEPTLLFGPSDSRDAVYPQLQMRSPRVPTAFVPAGASEVMLVEEAQRKLPSAVEQLHRMYGGELLGYLRARCPRTEDAQDIAQETWIEVLRRIDQFNPARGNFSAFVKYWAGIAALRWQREKKNAFEQTLLFSELASRCPEALKEEGIEAIASSVRAAKPDPEEMFASYERYSSFLRITFKTPSPPHQLLAFGFCKLLDWKPQRLVRELSDLLLVHLEDLFERAYLNEVPEERSLVNEAMRDLRAAMGRTLASAVTDPTTLSTYKELASQPIGGTRLRDYYRGDAEQNVSHWVYAVRRRVLSTLSPHGRIS